MKGFMTNGLTTSEEDYYFKKGYEQGKADERANTVQFIIDEFNRRTVCLGRTTAKMYVINTLNEILKELKEQKMSIGEYERLKKEYDEHNYLISFAEFCYEKGKEDEKAKIMKILNSADDATDAICLITMHFVSELGKGQR